MVFLRVIVSSGWFLNVDRLIGGSVSTWIVVGGSSCGCFVYGVRICCGFYWVIGMMG